MTNFFKSLLNFIVLQSSFFLGGWPPKPKPINFYILDLNSAIKKIKDFLRGSNHNSWEVVKYFGKLVSIKLSNPSNFASPFSISKIFPKPSWEKSMVHSRTKLRVISKELYSPLLKSTEDSKMSHVFVVRLTVSSNQYKATAASLCVSNNLSHRIVCGQLRS